MPEVRSGTKYVRVSINGDEVRVAPDVSINEGLSDLTSVAEFKLASRPASKPVDGDTVLIELVDLQNHRAYSLFGGTVNAVMVAAQPWSFIVRACDQLENFRRVRTTSDVDLSGMTEGEAWMALADICDIDYDPDDIVDSGYVLGEFVPIKWMADNQTPASQIIKELDDVFGHATITIENNRPFRFHVDRIPAGGTGSYRTFTNGVSFDFFTHDRSLGNRDAIQNAWRVLGAVDELSETCTGQVWASASSGSNIFPSRRVRVATGEFSSDLIQDESLAENIVRRLMRLTNRLQDEHSADTLNDSNIHPGTKIKIRDFTYGLNVGSSGRHFIVTNIVRTGALMSLTLTSGPPGEEGTVLTGFEKVCSDTHSSGDRPGDFEEPGFDFPPFDGGIGDDFDFDDDVDTGEDGDDFSPLVNCTTDGSLITCDDFPELDNCDNGGIGEDETGTPPPGLCEVGLSGSNWHQEIYHHTGPGYTVDCYVEVLWRADNVVFRRLSDANIDAVAAGYNSTSVGILYASDENIPDIRTDANDIIFGAPIIGSLSGVVTFNKAGSKMVISWPSVIGGIEQVNGPSITIYSVPGVSFTPAFSDIEYTIGVELDTENEGPVKTGDGPPNKSFGSISRDNGGYVISTPAALGQAIAFSVSANEPMHNDWGQTTVSSDIGSGYLTHNDFLMQGTVFPGEPADPPNPCFEEHDGHKLRIALHPGSAGTLEEPAIILEQVVIGHSLCESNDDYPPEA